jgi:hypothetical protein
VKINHIAYTVETLHTEPSTGGNGSNIVISGWLHGDEATKLMTLEVPALAKAWPIHEFSLRSTDLIQYFGLTAANRRFHLTAPIGNAMIPFQDAKLRIQFRTGDALSIPVGGMFKGHRPMPSPEISRLMMRFESLGDNSEFGLMQRSIGSERLGLFRYASTLRLPPLVEGLQTRFEDFATPGDLQFHLLGGEWMAVSQHYGFEFHTHRYAEQFTEDRIREPESLNLRFLSRLLLEDIEDGHKIFVRRNGLWGNAEPEEGMRDLYHSLRAIGPARLLWVTLADHDHPHGTVVRRDEGLFRGYIDNLADYAHAFDHSTASWITLLQEAVKVIDAPARL